ncbi:hypothetical protein [Emticicia aquatica]|nr:hypothetical protein [Emticicia aquatica]
MGFTFISFWNEWQESHRVKESSFVVISGDKLVFKMQISMPYQTEWRNDIIEGNTAIYEGDFYQSYEQVYQKDTLYTYYSRLDVSRDNLLALMNEVHENLNLFSKKHKTSSQKALELFSTITKDYVELHSKTIAWFLVEDLPTKNYHYTAPNSIHILSVNAPPPMFS